MQKWVEHLLKCDRRFAKDPLFVMVVTNIMQKRQALQLGSLYADNVMSDFTVKQLKENMEAGDKSVLKGLFCFGKDIKGTPQFFAQQMCKSVNFLRDIRIESEDTEMFNLFLTFSAADLQWTQLHKLLPGSEKYLGKKLVKNMNDIPEDANPDDYITEREDYILRFTAVNENIDIVNAFFQKRIELLWEKVLKPIFGGKYYIMRFEMQARGTIHCHMVISMKRGLSITELEIAKEGCPKDLLLLAKKFLSKADPTWKLLGMQLLEPDSDLRQEILSDWKWDIYDAGMKLVEFNSHVAGVTAVHPEKDPNFWPGPYGRNVYKPPNNPLRECFTEKETKEELLEYYTGLINRVMLHKCSVGYCLDPKKVKTDTIVDEDGTKRKVKKMYCRFQYPFWLNGFKGTNEKDSEFLEKVELTPLTDEEFAAFKLEEFYRELYDPTVHGSSFQGSLNLLRNHPTINNHIAELLVIWAANTDQKTITSYEQVLNYILKYVMKPEKASDFLNNMVKSICKDLDDADQ